MLEVVPQRVGFRKIELKKELGQVWVNGQPVLFKGADRHELDPLTGYQVSRERMIEDIRVMKENNLNAVRTCHYPDDPEWYNLCDEYGLYVVCEANIESHGMGYGERTLAKEPAYAKAHLERNQRMVETFKIILRLFSGRWEMKPVTDRTLWLVTTGSNREMAAVLYNMNRQDAELIRILFVRCMPT